jgi:hypothetical protein
VCVLGLWGSDLQAKGTSCTPSCTTARAIDVEVTGFRRPSRTVRIPRPPVEGLLARMWKPVSQFTAFCSTRHQYIDQDCDAVLCLLFIDPELRYHRLATALLSVGINEADAWQRGYTWMLLSRVCCCIRISNGRVVTIHVNNQLLFTVYDSRALV